MIHSHLLNSCSKKGHVIKKIWSFDTLVKLNSLTFIYRGYNNLLPLNIQYRLTKNT